MGQTNEKTRRGQNVYNEAKMSRRAVTPDLDLFGVGTSEGVSASPESSWMRGGAGMDPNELLLHALMSQLETMEKEMIEKKIISAEHLEEVKHLMTKQIDKLIKQKGVDATLQSFITKEPFKTAYAKIMAKADEQVKQVVQEQAVGSGQKVRERSSQQSRSAAQTHNNNNVKSHKKNRNSSAVNNRAITHRMSPEESETGKSSVDSGILGSSHGDERDSNSEQIDDNESNENIDGDTEDDSDIGEGDSDIGEGDSAEGEGDSAEDEGDSAEGEGDSAEDEGDSGEGDGDSAEGEGDGDSAEGEGDSGDGDGDSAEGEGDSGDGDGDSAEGEGDDNSAEGEGDSGDGDSGEPKSDHTSRRGPVAGKRRSTTETKRLAEPVLSRTAHAIVRKPRRASLNTDRRTVRGGGRSTQLDDFKILGSLLTPDKETALFLLVSFLAGFFLLILEIKRTVYTFHLVKKAIF
jgi:hypothetical protein